MRFACLTVAVGFGWVWDQYLLLSSTVEFRLDSAVWSAPMLPHSLSQFKEYSWINVSYSLGSSSSTHFKCVWVFLLRIPSRVPSHDNGNGYRWTHGLRSLHSQSLLATDRSWRESPVTPLLACAPPFDTCIRHWYTLLHHKCLVSVLIIHWTRIFIAFQVCCDPISSGRISRHPFGNTSTMSVQPFDLLAELSETTTKTSSSTRFESLVPHPPPPPTTESANGTDPSLSTNISQWLANNLTAILTSQHPITTNSTFPSGKTTPNFWKVMLQLMNS